MLKSRRFWLGLGVSLVFLALFFTRIDLGEMAEALGGANYVFMVPGVALYFIAVLFRTWRWKFLLRPLRSISTMRLYPVVVVGYMANNLLPVRLGEVVRSYYLWQREGLSKTTTLATVVVERVFDGLALLFLLAIVAPFLPFIGLVSELSEGVQIGVWYLVLIGTAPFLIALGLLIWMALFPSRFLRGVRFLLRPFPLRLTARLEALPERFVDGLRVLQSPQRLLALFVLSLPVWLLEVAMYYVIVFSFGLEASFSSLGILAATMIAVTAIANLAISIPSAPGGVGPFEFFAVTSLIFMGVEAGVASAYVVALHVALLVPVTVAGLLYLWGKNISLAQLTRGGNAEGIATFRRTMKGLPSKGDERL